MSDPSPWIFETSHQTFERDVIDRSREVPVVVDFWSSWCQPCLLLGPLLEKLIDELQGKLVLVKANTDQMPDVAAAFGVSAIPARGGFARTDPGTAQLQLRQVLTRVLRGDHGEARFLFE